MTNILSHLFFFFLSAPILSPYISGTTFYLYSVFPLFDVAFLKWVVKIIKKTSLLRLILILLTLFLILLFSFDFGLIVKIVTLYICVLYASFCYTRGVFYLYRYVVLNVVLAMVQFLFLFVNPDVSTFLGPTNISKMILGGLAGPTNTNFYSIGLLPRVSGLSREGGFFSSYLSVVFFILMKDSRVYGVKRIMLWGVLIVGIVVSISKMTLVLVLVPLFIYFRRKLDSVGLLGVMLATISLLLILNSYLFYHTDVFFDLKNDSFIHRFSGYGLFFNSTVYDLARGTSLVSLMNQSGFGMSSISYFFAEDFNRFCGWPYLFLGYGLPVFFTFVFMIFLLGFPSFSFPILTLFTIAVDPVTTTGFVVLAWFYCFMPKLKVRFCCSPVVLKQS